MTSPKTKLDAKLTLPRHQWPRAFAIIRRAGLQHDTECGDGVITIHLSKDGKKVLKEALNDG